MGISTRSCYKELMTGFKLDVGEFGENAQKRGFALDWILG